MGYDVCVTAPYQGAELMRRHDRLAERRESLQIELNPKLCIDKDMIARHAGFARLRTRLPELIQAVCVYARVDAA